jgi:hypothetical protein
MVEPPFRGGQSLPLEKLDEYAFQEFSRELFLTHQPRAATARIYGSRVRPRTPEATLRG